MQLRYIGKIEGRRISGLAAMKPIFAILGDL
jgi:hypothetical protein